MVVYMVIKHFDDELSYESMRYEEDLACFANKKDALEWACNYIEEAIKDEEMEFEVYDEEYGWSISIDDDEDWIVVNGLRWSIAFEIKEWEVQ